MREQTSGQHRQAGSQAGGLYGGGAPIDKERARCGKPRRRAGRPWILRILAAFGAAGLALARLIAHFSRKNFPLAIGIALFVLLLAIAVYNAFFRQNPVARPVLFSTRAGAPAAQAGRRPFVRPVISTEALSREKAGSAAHAPLPETGKKAAEDKVGALITAEERRFTATAAAAKTVKAAPPPREEKAAAAPFAAVKPGKREKIAVPQARPPAAGHKTAARTERAEIIRIQRALQKSGARGLRATGAWDAASRKALRGFQGRHGLVMTGQADKETVAKMRQLHLW